MFDDYQKLCLYNRIILRKEKKMTFKIDIKSLIIGLLAGLVVFSIMGAASSRNPGVYQLSMAANEYYVIYGRIHTVTGKIETWKYMINTNDAVPHLGDNTKILLGPGEKN